MTSKFKKPQNGNRRSYASKTTVPGSRSAESKPTPEAQKNMQAYISELRNLLNEEKSLRAAEERQKAAAARPCGVVANATNRLDQLDRRVQDSVFRTVCAAIEYGYANNIVERMGNCFVLKERRVAPKPARSRPKVTARRFCCTRCKASFLKTTRRSTDDKRNICGKCRK